MRITYADLDPAVMRQHDLLALHLYASPELKAAVTERDLEDPDFVRVLRQTGMRGPRGLGARLVLAAWRQERT